MFRNLIVCFFIFWTVRLTGQAPTASFNWETDDGTTCVQFTNTSANVVQYEWTAIEPSRTTVDTNASFFYCFADTGCYQVRLVVWDVNGNADTTAQNVCIRINSSLFIPNAFTPNGDGINDIFKVEGTWVEENTFQMRIYDYWGAMVFSSFDINRGWNGADESSGRYVPAGYYLVELMWYDTNYEEHTYRGGVYVWK